MRLLFVDVTPAAVAALEARLKPVFADWQMQFVVGADAALALLEQGRFDAVVSELGSAQAGYDGTALLAKCRDRWPAMVRLILSSETRHDAVMRALPVAHQFLAKPFVPADLRHVVSRACALQAKLYSNGVMAALGSVKSLPAVPRLYQLLAQELDSGRATPKSVATIIEQDMSMTVRLLQLVNSAFFGLARRITTIREAVTYLGFEPIRNLVASTEMFRAMSKLCSPTGFSLDEVQRHSQRVGMVAASLLADREQSRTAYCAGMLHDIGRVVLAVSMPEAYSRATEMARRLGIAPHEAEQQVFACTHADIGAHLLVLWGLPPALIEAVAFHHTPAALEDPQFGIAGAIHVADALEHGRDEGLSATRLEPALARIDSDWLARVGKTDALPGWVAGLDVAQSAAA
jgi:HD-like signal output (HDOD) protein